MLKKRIAPKRLRIESFKNLTEDQLRPCSDDELKVWLEGINKLQKTDAKVDACKIFIEHLLKTRESEKWIADQKQEAAKRHQETIKAAKNKELLEIAKESCADIIEVSDGNTDCEIPQETDTVKKLKEIGKNKAKVSQTKPKSKKEKSANIQNTEKKPGVVAEIVNCLNNAGKTGITKAEILDHLISVFPDRDAEKMKATVTVQVPGRISKEKFLVEKFDGNKYRPFKK